MIHNIGVTGKIRKGKKHLPDIKNFKLKKGEHKLFYDKNTGFILALIKDKKEFLILSTFDSFCFDESNTNEKRKKRIRAINNYNLYARGVDQLNQLAQYYRYEHRTRKWWKPIFYQFMEIIMINSYILYNHQHSHQNISFKEFRTKVACDLFEKGSNNTIKLRRKQLVVHNQVHISKKWAKKCKCWKVCKTCFKCEECSRFYQKEITLCREDCFARFHLSPETYLCRKKKQKSQKMEIE